jgi:predicted short-subunit dehydrogenase-like oxidoreductase (DUF2520 family)
MDSTGDADSPPHATPNPSRARRSLPRRVMVIGAGKLGACLHRAMRAAGVRSELRPGRAPLPAHPIEADAIVLAVRDRHVPELARALAERGLIGHRRVAVFHCAGSLGPEALAPAKAAGPLVSTAQLHPMISFAHPAFCPSLARGQLHVLGDEAAVRVGRALGRALGMSPRTLPGLDLVAYHAAAGLVANGAAALAAAGIEVLERAGVDARTAASMLGPLLRSVAENVERLGLPDALTGPVRRGEAASVGRHLATLERLAPHVVGLYRECGRVQLPLARALGEASSSALDEVDRALRPT